MARFLTLAITKLMRTDDLNTVITVGWWSMRTVNALRPVCCVAGVFLTVYGAIEIVA